MLIQNIPTNIGFMDSPDAGYFDPNNMDFFISENISPGTENVLRNLKIDGNTVKITEQLDRKTYEAVNKVLERLGGKWNRSAKVHIFPSDPTERINTVLTTGKLEPKIKTGYFPTPPEIAQRMVNMLDLKPGDKVLEPSAGQGGILDQLPKGTQVVIGEILPENIRVLKTKGYTVNFDNFLGVEIEGITKVIMNPPFENQQDVEHVTHALRILQPGGTLVSVMSPGIKFRDNKKTTEFIEMLDRDYYHEIIDLPAGSFKESGTGVNAVLLKATKPMSTPSTVSSGFVPDKTKVSPELAARSHMGTSWDPERRAQQEIAGFAGYVQEVHDNLKSYASTEAQKAFLDTEIKRFQDSFANKYNTLLAAKGRTMSTFITGGSGFNVRRAEKANDAEHNKYLEMIEFRDRAQAAILRELKKMAVEEAGGELEVLTKKVSDAKKNHEFMVKANVIIRKNIPDEQKIKEIQALAPISEITIRKLLVPDFAKRIGFADYVLTNDNANIKRMEERVKELEKKEVTALADVEFTGGVIHDAKDDDRIHIIFDKKPDETMIETLKGSGWRWAPSVGAWSRKRTDAAIDSARRIVGLPLEAPKFVTPKVDPTKEMFEDIKKDKEHLTKLQLAITSLIVKVDQMPLRQQDVNRAKKLIADLPNATLEELIKLKPTIKHWGERVAYIKNELDYIYNDYLGRRGVEKLQHHTSKTPDTIVSIVERSNLPPPTTPIIPTPQTQALIELRWVYGTQDDKWHLVSSKDRDFAHGITQERMKIIGQEAAKIEYLSPSFIQTVIPKQQPSPEEIVDLNKLILIIEKYVTEGITYEDFSTGRTFLYLSKSGVKLDPNNIPLKLKDDLKKAGYNSLSELWNDTSRKLRMKMYVPPKQPQRLLTAPKEPETKKYTTPRFFKKGTIARNNVTNEKFVLQTDVEALQQDKNAQIWSAHGYLIYLDDQRPAAIPDAKKPEKISSDDIQLLKQYEMITDYAIGQRITRNQGKLKDMAARKLVRIEKGKHGTMGSAYIEQERLGISEEISRLYRIQELRELIATQGRPEPWELTKEEYWRAGAGGKASEGRGTSDYNHTQAVQKAILEGKPVPQEVLKDYPDIITPLRKMTALEEWRSKLPKNLAELKKAKPNQEFEVKRSTFIGKPQVTIYRTFGGVKAAGTGGGYRRGYF
jgi:type I restriction-modification system DNA methylase subunit